MFTNYRLISEKNFSTTFKVSFFIKLISSNCCWNF